MADNVTVAGVPFATDEIGGFHHQIFKPAFGLDGAATLVSASNPLPVAATITGVATETTLSAINGKLGTLGQKAMSASAPVVIASDQAAIPVSGTVTTTPSGTQTVSGTVTVGNASLAVTGTFYQAIQPVSGTVAVSGSVAVTGPLTDTQLRATALPVSGTFFQATQPVSIAASVAVTGTFFQATQPISAASLPLPSGAATAAKQPALGTAGAASTDVITVQGIASGVAQPVSLTSTTITGSVAVTGPLTDTQLRATAVPVSGTVTANAGTGTMAISAANLPLPTGAATETTLAALNTKVTAVNTGAVTISAALPAGANSIGTVTVGANSLVSTANSTAVNLAGAAVFTGTSEDVSEYSAIMVSIFSSHASATDGLSMQQSVDGTNWDFTDVYTIPAATGKTFNVAVNAKFYRLVYTNGATLTTSLRIQTIHSKAVKRSSSVRAQDARSNENDFDEVAAMLALYNGTSWDRARGTIANGMAVDVTRLSALVAGSAVIGAVTQSGTWNVGSITTLPALVAGSAIVGKVGIDQTTPGTTNLVSIGTTGTVALNAAIPTGANTIGAVTGPAAAPLSLDATLTNHTQRLQSTTLAVTVTAAANTAATATLPAVAGQFHYITGIEIMRTSTAALAGTATLVVTSTNLPGSLAWSFGNAMAAGATQRDLVITFPNPIKSSVVNTATTVVMPAPGAAVLWRANVYYYTAA